MTRSPKPLPNLGGLTYRLRISRRRRSVGLTVTDNGDLVVHAPQGLSPEALRRVIAKNRAWIDKKQAERREALNRLETGKIYYLGKAFEVKLNSRGTTSLHRAEGFLAITLKSPQTDPWPQLVEWYWREAALLFNERVHFYKARMEVVPTSLEIRNWRRRWGECHPDGRLRFNWRLILLPREFIDYVIVHELAHLLVPGHPPKFWEEVGKILPDYADRRRWLRKHGAPFLLWKFEQA